MRLITTAFLMLVVCIGRLFAQETEKDISSEIKQVTVFLKGAQVTRRAKVALAPGTTLLKLTGMAPSVQEPSIQVDAPASAKILSVSFHINYMDETKKPEQIATLEAERRRILALIAEQKAEESVYQEEETILKTNKSIGGAERGVDIQELKVAMDYFRQRLQEIKQLQLQADRKIRQYNEALGKIEAQLAAVSGQRSKPTGEIVIKVSSKQAGTIPIEVKYLVQEASWFPSYDIRAKDIQSPVSITYKANVNQNSGEDWNQVQLTISSADPSRGGSRPILKPWYLGFNNHISGIYGASSPVQPGAGNYVRGRVMSADGEPLPGVNVLIKGATVGTVTDVNGFYSIPLTSDAQTLVFSYIGYNATEVGVQGRPNLDVTLAEDVTQLNEVVVTGYGNALQGKAAGIQIRGASSLSKESRSIAATEVVRQTNVEYTIDEPITVKSDGELRTTEMVAYDLKAIYEYYCAPKLDDDAFLTAKVLDWDTYNFMEGEASLFFEGKFIGKSILDTRNTSDTLTLSLGRDANVLVTREKVRDVSSRQFIGSNQKAVFEYDIQVRNKKALPVAIVIEDQVPITTDRDIDVTKLEDSKGDFDELTGAVKWRKTIAAGKTEKIKLAYAVRYPKGAQMILE